MKLTPTYTIIIAAILVVGIGGLVYWQKQESLKTATIVTTPEQQTTTQEIAETDTTKEPETPPSTATTISLSQVAEHNSKTSCWSTINGSVYDLTSWIPNHPGGERAILQICGKDGSSKFNGMHGDNPKQAAI